MTKNMTKNIKRNFQLVMQFPLTDVNTEIFDRIIAIEKELAMLLKDKHQLGEHAMSENTMSILINTADPEEAFEIAKNAVPEEDLGVMSVAMKGINSHEYTVIWPEDYQGEFRIDKHIDKIN